MEYFGHSNIVRKSTIAFMDLFNDMYIEKYRKDGSSQLFRVPIQFANREKWLQKLETRVHNAIDKDGNYNNAIFDLDMILPRMSVNILSLAYDTIRKVGKTNTLHACEPCSLNQMTHPTIHTPAPWNIEFELSIISKNMDDGLQIIEQILPYFQPSLSVNIFYKEGFASDSVPIIIDSVTPSHDEELEDRSEAYRHFIWILNFRMKVNFHAPTALRGRIKDIIYNIHPNERTDPHDSFTQYQLSSEVFDVVHDSTTYWAMQFVNVQSGSDPSEITLKLWKDESLPKVTEEFGSELYEFVTIRSDGGLEPFPDGPCAEFLIHDIQGNGVYYNVRFRWNVIIVETTDEVAVDQIIDIKEVTTNKNFRLAIQDGEVIVVPT